MWGRDEAHEGVGTGGPESQTDSAPAPKMTPPNLKEHGTFGTFSSNLAPKSFPSNSQ